MNNGFIYPIINQAIVLLTWLNIVEYLKLVFKKIYSIKKKSQLTIEEKRYIANIAIDTFQIIKWSTIVVFWAKGYETDITLFITFYLIISNLFTYFNYHVWGTRFERTFDKETSNRRFINTILSIFYFILCYAYLYEVHYADSINWPNYEISTFNSIYISICTSFTLTLGDFSPKFEIARMLFLTQVMNTFIFISIILTNAVPAHMNKE